MTEVAFYHLSRSNLEETLPKLLAKTLDAGKRAVVMAGSPERVEQLNGLLWTFDDASWLPHGSIKDANPEQQPVWLTDTQENPNGAQFLFLTDGATCENVDTFERCFEIFDGRDEASLTAARVRWKAYKDKSFDLTYWQQSDNGAWEKKET